MVEPEHVTVMIILRVEEVLEQLDKQVSTLEPQVKEVHLVSYMVISS